MNQTRQNDPAGAKGWFNRRDMLKGLATLPVLGLFFAKLYKKYDMVQADQLASENFLKELGLGDAPSVLPSNTVNNSGKQLRLGFIGYGSRGEYLMRSAGFAHPKWIASMEAELLENKNDPRLADFMAQDDLNIVFNGVCDIFDIRAEEALETVRVGSNTGKEYSSVKRFRRYQDMMESPDIDAVIIATPEHLHVPMALAAAEAGKHVYLEKPFSYSIPEAYQLREAIKRTGIKFQLGHQSRQTDAYIMAREVVKKDILGKINLVTLTTNRNDPDGAWLYDIHPDATPMNIDFRQFLNGRPRRPDAAMMKRYFRWRLWYDYGSGLSGDLLTHEYDSVNMMLDLGIPKSAMASGGVYHYKDGREVPDVYNVSYEYPDRDLTMMYSATLSNTSKRGKSIMGSDGTMVFEQLHASMLTVLPDSGSERFKEKLENGELDPDLPMFAYTPGSKGFDAVSSATEKYFAARGLLYTYRDGKRVDTTHLHIAEWLDAIRNNGITSCNEDMGFQEAIVAHMGTLSYKLGRKVEWDAENERVVGVNAPLTWMDSDIMPLV